MTQYQGIIYDISTTLFVHRVKEIPDLSSLTKDTVWVKSVTNYGTPCRLWGIYAWMCLSLALQNMSICSKSHMHRSMSCLLSFLKKNLSSNNKVWTKVVKYSDTGCTKPASKQFTSWNFTSLRSLHSSYSGKDRTVCLSRKKLQCKLVKGVTLPGT